MKLLQELSILPESRSAPLYHGLSLEKAKYIFEHDEMPGRWEHYIPIEGKKFSGNSLTRNKRLELHYEILITFDQSKLAARYKIIPVDASYIFHGGRNLPTGVKFKSLDHLRDRIHSPANVSSEEFVIGDIKELHKYIIEVTLNKKVQFMPLIEKYCEKFNIKLTIKQNVRK